MSTQHMRTGVTDTPRLEAVDVLNLFVAACENTSAYEALVEDFKIVRLVLADAPALDKSLDWLVRRHYAGERWVNETFSYDGDGWWRVKFETKTGLWRIHEDTGEVRPRCR